MAATTGPWTRADLEDFPDDGNRYEVLDGRLLVTPQPSVWHQHVAVAIVAELLQYCREHGLGFVLGPGAIPRGKNELQPDGLVVLGPKPTEDVKWEDLPTPALVVEVLSPSTRHRDLGVKREAYLQWGIPEYWIVNLDARLVTVVRPGCEDALVSDVLRWQPLAALPALEIELKDVFR